MHFSDLPPKRKLQAAKLTAALAMLDAARSTIEAELAEIEIQPDHDELLSTRQTLERYGLGHEGVRGAAERGELSVQRGARGKLLVLDSEIRRFIASRPYRPTPRRGQAPESLDAWEAEADRALQLGGRKR